MFQSFKYSFLVTIVCLAVAAWWGTVSPMGWLVAVFLMLVLGIMEISLSFDNAVVNASILKDMDEKWQRRFLTIGILIAVVGMRLIFPIAIVAIATGLGTMDVMNMALQQPQEYARHLNDSHIAIASFGGIFLLLVFLSFMFDADKEVHWLKIFEEKMRLLGKLDIVSILIALITLFAMQALLPIDEIARLTVLVSGLAGVVLYIAVSSLDVFFESDQQGHATVNTAKRSGVMAFLYLEVLDASFSFDGVIGAFAISSDIVIIMLGLAVGAMFVRSLTIYLVHQGTLNEYIYLEHGAHYGIGALAIIMLLGIHFHISEIITGLVGISFIVLALYSSVRYRRLHPT
jgi:hypothetical protein